eukprot:TRINITY_DN9778_c0_g1_i1.p1 TRINITY_DN9778_c0_g1~~TRINITY_DN9778_c0_g1_i1.p1  ORF type:complete len:853 (-),score=248.87 TRINITY_DN9778_c0_g1_i1:75-2633(-)
MSLDLLPRTNMDLVTPSFSSDVASSTTSGGHVPGEEALAMNASFYDKTRWKKDPKYPLICGFLFIHATLHTTFASILHSIRTLALPHALDAEEDDALLLQNLLSDVELNGSKGGKKNKNKKGKKTPAKKDHEHIDLAKEKTKKMVVEIAQRYEHWKTLHRQHAVGEDTVIFPAILKALPPSTLTLSSHQHGHKEQERRIKFIESIFKGMIENPSEKLRMQLVQAMQSFCDDQESHYREEENDIVPKCLAHLSPQQLGPLVPQILNDYRLYKSAIQWTPAMSNPLEKKHHHVSTKNQDREEQEAILNDLAFLEEKRSNIIRFWKSLQPAERSKLLIIDHPMLVGIWSKKLALRGGATTNDDAKELVLQGDDTQLELSLDFFTIEKDPHIGTNILRLGPNVVADGSLLFSALDRLTGNLFLRAPLFQIFRRLLTPSPNASPTAENAAQEMLLIFEIERLLRLVHRSASESILLNQISLEKEEQKAKEEQKKKKNQRKRQKQKEKEKLQKQIMQKKLEEEREEAERKQKQEETIIIIKTEERRRQERLRNLRKQAQLKKLILLMEELQLQHNIAQQNEAELEYEDDEIEFDDENDEVFDGTSNNRSSELEIVISDDDEEDDEEEAESDVEPIADEEDSNNAAKTTNENLEEILSVIYKTTDKILNDHARNVAIRQFYSPSNYLQLIHISLNPVDQIFALYQSRGNSIVYHKYSITHLQHALQCATLAEKDGAQATEIAAAFLHDIGCLLFADTTHDQIGCEFLSQCGFKKEVTQPILWHEMYEDDDDHDTEKKETAIVVRRPLERQTEFSQEAKALMKRDRAALENVQSQDTSYNLEHFRTYLEQCLQRYSNSSS